MTNAWIMLVVAGLLEVGWAIGLKYADGLNFKTRPLASTLTLAAMVVSMYLLAQAIRTIPVGTGYAIWTGIGAIGAATLGIILFQEPATLARIASLVMVVAGIVGLKLFTPVVADQPAPVPEMLSGAMLPFFIGTYTNGTSKGIYRSSLYLQTGEMTAPELLVETRNPSFLALHPTRNVLYAVAELRLQDQDAGGVKAFELTPAAVVQRSALPSGGDGPCYVSVDAGGRVALAANYGSGSVASYSVDDAGTLSGPRTVNQHVGQGFHPQRQKGPHAHSMLSDPSGRFALAADLGLDSIFIHRVDQATGTVERIGETKVEPGSGPRHMAFAPGSPFLYLVNELSNTVCVYRWDSEAGTLTLVQTIGTLPADFKEHSSTAEIAVHPTGRFLYVSNRGHNSISCFIVEPATGRLTLTGAIACGGDTPRHFALTPDGRFLIVANQKSDGLASFRVNLESGLLEPTGHLIGLGAPSCVRFGRAGM